MDYRENTVRITIQPGSKDKHQTILQKVRTELSAPASEERSSPTGQSDYIALLNAIQTPVLLVDVHGHILDANESASLELFYTREEFRRLDVSLILSGLDPLVMNEIMTNCSNGSGISLEGECLRKDGVTYPCHTAVSKLCLCDGEYYCFHIQDISQHHKAITALNVATTRIARAERLETSGTVAGQIAHDFNNLLSPLLAYPHLIRRDLPEESPGLKYLDVMEKTVHDMAHMTEQLLALSRRGQINHRVFNLNDVVKHVLTLLESSLPENVVVKEELEPDLMNVKGGHGQLVRVLQNLSHNAVDAMSETGGTLTIRTENTYLDNDAGRYEKLEIGEYVKVTLQDTGPGIEDEIKEKIFDPFFTTKKTSKQRGSGLGLSVVHGIIQDHDGQIDLQSQVGVGTTFSIYIPVSREDADIDIDSLGGSERILVIDDDPVQIDLLNHVLTKLGHKVKSVTSGEAGLKMIQAMEESEYPDLIIVDLIMHPGMGGMETIKHIRDIKPSVKTVIISGHPELKTSQATLRIKPDAFVPKPFTLPVIAEVVHGVLAGTYHDPDLVSDTTATDKPLVKPVPKKRVLVVDDEETIRQLFQVIISSEMPDVEVVTASDGLEGVETFKEFQPDVIIMDLHMPNLDGKAAFKRIMDLSESEEFKKPSVVFCTGFAPPDSIKHITDDDDSHGLLRKPITGAVLIKAIKERL
jgi:PAS domain S-box-containing protein